MLKDLELRRGEIERFLLIKTYNLDPSLYSDSTITQILNLWHSGVKIQIAYTDAEASPNITKMIDSSVPVVHYDGPNQSRFVISNNAFNLEDSQEHDKDNNLVSHESQFYFNLLYSNDAASVNMRSTRDNLVKHFSTLFPSKKSVAPELTE